MRTQRGPLLAKLNEAVIGTSVTETIEQSNCFVFAAGELVTFNDSIAVRIPSPIDFDAVVPAAKLTGVLAGWPDEEVILAMRDGELRIKSAGKKRVAGIACCEKVSLPVGAVPRPGKWSRLGEGVNAAMQQASKTCGDDQNQYVNTCVHVTPDRVEGCDNDRYLRVAIPTGFPNSVLIPASSVHELERLELTKVCVGDGWVHFLTAAGSIVSLRCSHQAYHSEVDELLKMESPKKIILPAELKGILERSKVFHSVSFDEQVEVSVAGGRLTLTSRTEDGWSREWESVPYDGPPVSFFVQPQFLAEALARTRDVKVDDRKMKLTTGPVQFVVSLTAKTDNGPADEE